ncbi:MAG: homoserine dehydrogenase [Clostridiaceae bacterium]
MKSIGLALLGLGTVGSGVMKVLHENSDTIRTREGLNLEIKKILVKDRSKQRTVDVAAELLTDNFEDILNDESIDIIAEFMGGDVPAFTYLYRALQKGKSVVTANKEVIAKHWDELEQAAKTSGAGLYYEACVGGGIPIIESIIGSLQSNHIKKYMGIINGTTNFILTKMSEEGRSFQDVLTQAQQLGYAEPDPTADIEGFDARYKLSILSTIGFRNRVTIDQIYCQGISQITSEDITYAKELGFAVKLLAIAKNQNGRVEARVHPTFIPLSHPLASVRDSFNAVFVEGDMVGELMFYGRGAGDLPTASALVSDMIKAANNQGSHHRILLDEAPVIIENDWLSEYYLRLSVLDQPGVMAKIAGIFGQHQISLNSVIQKQSNEDQATLIFITHQTRESLVNRALDEIKALDVVHSVGSVIRVEK